MNAYAADAMQCRAFGSRLLDRNPARINFVAAYPSQIVHWPEPNMPIAVGPLSLSVCLAFDAMRSNASSQLTGVNSPSFAKTPFLLRSNGVVRRSAPYIIFDRK